MFLFQKTFFVCKATPLQVIRHNTMSLVHYGFSREEVMWMPITEMNDYILLINQQIEQENGELADSVFVALDASTQPKDETPTINSVFKGSFKPHI